MSAQVCFIKEKCINARLPISGLLSFRILWILSRFVRCGFLIASASGCSGSIPLSFQDPMGLVGFDWLGLFAFENPVNHWVLSHLTSLLTSNLWFLAPKVLAQNLLVNFFYIITLLYLLRIFRNFYVISLFLTCSVYDKICVRI